MLRCRHAVAAVGSYIFIYGGLKGSTLLDDFLLAEDGGGSQLSICDPRSPTWSVCRLNAKEFLSNESAFKPMSNESAPLHLCSRYSCFRLNPVLKRICMLANWSQYTTESQSGWNTVFLMLNQSLTLLLQLPASAQGV